MREVCVTYFQDFDEIWAIDETCMNRFVGLYYSWIPKYEHKDLLNCPAIDSLCLILFCCLKGSIFARTSSGRFDV